jgi:hypothetical protein
MAVPSPPLHAWLPVLVALVAVWTMPAHASRLPEPVENADYELRRVGGGDLSWLGRPVYAASLWTPAGRFDGYGSGEPVALSLWYQRSFSRGELVRITRTAWRLLDVADERRDAWAEALRGLWNDVAPGDNLTAVVLPGGATRFYDQDKLLGEVSDPAFGPAFLSIWLDPRSVLPDLRTRLLGDKHSIDSR